METTLVERLKTAKHGGFQAKPRYYSHGDYVTYFISPNRCVAKRINAIVTVYVSVDNGDLVGCKLKGVSQLMKTLKSACFLATDGKVFMGMLILSAAAIDSEKHHEVLNLAEKFGKGEVPVGEICEQAIEPALDSHLKALESATRGIRAGSGVGSGRARCRPATRPGYCT